MTTTTIAGLNAATFANLDDIFPVMQMGVTRKLTLAQAVALANANIDPVLIAFAALVTASNTMPYYSAPGTFATASLTAAGRAVLAGVSAAAQRTTLGAAASGANTDITTITGSAATLTTARTIAASGDATWSISFNGSTNITAALTLAASGVSAGTYGSVTVDTKGRVTSASTLTPVANGGTNASTAAGARTNLGVTIGGTVIFSATKDGVTAQSIPNNTLTKITLPTQTVTVGTGFSTGTGTFTAPIAGTYSFEFQAGFTSGAADEAITSQLYLNGARHTTGAIAWSRAVSNGVNSLGTAKVTLAVNDTIELYAFISAAAARNAALNAGNCFLNGTILA